MEEIKVNDYIRTVDGYIRKVTQVNKKGTYEGICYGAYSVDKPYKNSQGISAKKIKSHSKDIIDLIECGDYINGSRVIDIAQASVRVVYTEDATQKMALIPKINEDIKSIITKEQFNQMKYIVGDESNVKD